MRSRSIPRRRKSSTRRRPAASSRARTEARRGAGLLSARRSPEASHGSWGRLPLPGPPSPPRGGFVCKSPGGGARWRRVPLDEVVDAPVAIDPKAPQTVYAGGYEGVHKSTDGGEHWALVREGSR